MSECWHNGACDCSPEMPSDLAEDLVAANAARAHLRDVIERHHRDFEQVQSLVNGGLRTGEHEAALRLIGSLVRAQDAPDKPGVRRQGTVLVTRQRDRAWQWNCTCGDGCEGLTEHAARKLGYDHQRGCGL